MNFLHRHAENSIKKKMTRKYEMDKFRSVWITRDKSTAHTCSTTSTAYELPLHFCEPSNFEPLYSRVFGKPNCFDCDGGGGVKSTLTGILTIETTTTTKKYNENTFSATQSPNEKKQLILWHVYL